MTKTTQKLGWIGVGRMGGPMAERLLAAGHSVAIWNRTKAKADPFGKRGAQVVERLAELSEVDVLFTMVSEGKDLEEAYFGQEGLVTNGKGKLPKIFVDCSSISVEDSSRIRDRLKQHDVQFVASPVSGNGQVTKAGKLSAVVSGPESAAKAVMPLINVFAPKGVSYVGDGELARVCKIAHNVMLGVVIDRERLKQFGVAEETILGIDAAVRREVDEATETCKAAPPPALDILTTDVYADGGFAWRN
jgi:3-hydroxyisobutyrate dehydrogenase